MNTPRTIEAPNAQAAAWRMAEGVLRKGYEFVALHTYTDIAGNPLYWRARAKHPKTGEKWIRPLYLTAKGYAMGEPEPASGAGKPLYRLDELAQSEADEVVFVTEGELKADHLGDLGLTATTSGSADSAAKADWSVLAGRDVRIWPDHDEAGERYAQAVKLALEGIARTVEVLDVEALGLPQKGDAVDWLAERPAAKAEDVLALACRGDSSQAAPALSLNQITPVSPTRHSFGGGEFRLTKTGIYLFKDAGDDGEKPPLWVCSPIRVLAKTRDERSGDWGRLLEWHDDDEVRHQWAMPLELLEGDGADVRRELARLGVHLGNGRSARDALASYLKVWPVEQRARCVDRLGWHGEVYVMPHTTIGEAEEVVVFQNPHAVNPAVSSRGHLDGWRNEVAALAQGNSRLVFAICVAFAGTLAGLVDEDSGGFQFRGKSSSGKSTALKVAASVWGKPEEYVRVWRATANGLEGVAAVHNDGVLILDELSQCDPKQAGEAAYMLANGQGKSRASQSGAARNVQRWRLLFLSSGEVSLNALMAQAGKRPNVGQEVRMADIEADAGAGIGLFEDLHGHEAGATFAQTLKEATAKHFGAVGMAWIEQAVKSRREIVEIVEDAITQFVSEQVPKGASGQVSRVARRFGLAAAAGELASHFGLTGWPEGEAASGTARCFQSWLASFGGGSANKEDSESLAQIKAFFESHGASRFEDSQATIEQRVISRAGFIHTNQDKEREFWVLPEVFKKEICQGRDVKAIEKLLIAKRWIIPGGDDRPTQKRRIAALGNTTRVYHFTPEMWRDAE